MVKRIGGPKKRSLRLGIEILEDRTVPATLITDAYGSLPLPGVPAGVPYSTRAIYGKQVPDYQFDAVYRPSGYVTRLDGNQFQIGLSSMTSVTVPSVSWWNAVLTDFPGDPWTYSSALVSPRNDLTFTVNSYQAYADPATVWGPARIGVPYPTISAGVDVRTNLDAPGVNNTPTYQWIQVVTQTLEAPGNPPDTRIYVDHTSRNTPFHGEVLGLNQKAFVDITRFAPSANIVTWRAETFLVLSTGNQEVTVYPDGFTWGWIASGRAQGQVQPPAIVGAATPRFRPGGNAFAHTYLDATIIPANPIQGTGTVSYFNSNHGNAFLGRGTVVLENGAYKASRVDAYVLSLLWEPGQGDNPQVHNVIAIFTGDDANPGVVGTAFTVTTIRPGGQIPDMVLNSSSSTVGVDDDVTLTATFTGTEGLDVPTGNVKFYDSNALLGSVPIEDGVAEFDWSGFSVGRHNVTAVYEGDDEYIAGTDSLQQIITDSNGGSGSAIVSTTTVSSSDATSLIGQSVTLSAGVVAASGGGTPTGSVTFYDGTTSLGSDSLDPYGEASINVSNLGLGFHNITAIYAGDTNYQSSTGTLSQQVVRKSSATTATVSANTAVHGETLTLSAAVSAESGNDVPAGTVTFYDGDLPIATETLDEDGEASIEMSDLLVGEHTITVVYNGDDTFEGSASGESEVAVDKADTTAVVSILLVTVSEELAEANVVESVDEGLTVTLAANIAISSPGGGIPGGTVTFYDGQTELGTAHVNDNGNAFLDIDDFAVGSHAITAVYSGDDSFNDSSADEADLTVNHVNVAPVNTFPASQLTGKDTNLVFSTGNGNLISIGDVDAGSSSVQVALTATNGTVTLSGTTGLSFSFSDSNGTGAGDGTADATMTFRGTVSNVNAALAGLTFTPTSSYTGSASVQIVTNDLGNTGSGGVLTDSDTVSITVASPWVGGLSVASSTTAGGGSVTITGVGFSGAFNVYFGSTSASFTVNSDTSITATVPSHVVAQVHVTVTNMSGTSPTSAADLFTYRNGAPSGANNTVNTVENSYYTFSANDFGFSDWLDIPVNNLWAVKITTLPTVGTLTLDGVAVSLNQSISVADINAGKLRFTPTANTFGTAYDSFGFKVQDDGGTEYGGIDTDPTERIMTINVSEGI